MKVILTRDDSGIMCMWKENVLLHKEDTDGEFGEGFAWFGKNKKGNYVSPIKDNCRYCLGGYYGLKKGAKMRVLFVEAKEPTIKRIK